MTISKYEETEDTTFDPEVFIREHHPAPPPTGRLIVKRDGHSITRQIPKPIVLVDTREKYPFDFSRFKNWIGGEKSHALKAGDYSKRNGNIACFGKKDADRPYNNLNSTTSKIF
jgi:hypothetical protein